MFSGKNRFGPSSNGRSKFGIFGRGNKQQNSNSKKNSTRTWILFNKRRNENDLSVMMSGDSSPTLQSSIPNSNADLPNDSRQGKINNSSSSAPSSPSPRTSKSSDKESPEDEDIKEALPIVRTSLPTPEPKPVRELNGLELKNDRDRIDGVPLKPRLRQRDPDDDSCLIKCIYFTQQCCDCSIM